MLSRKVSILIFQNYGYMLITLLHNSPTAQTGLLVCSCSSLTTWALCVGEHLQHTTAGLWQASSMNSCRGQSPLLYIHYTHIIILHTMYVHVHLIFHVHVCMYVCTYVRMYYMYVNFFIQNQEGIYNNAT